jgi:hypothetical protein
MKDSYFLAFEQVSCRLLSLLEVPVRANWVGREISREEARHIVENVTGFFSVLYEWSWAEAPDAANDNEQTAVRGETLTVTAKARRSHPHDGDGSRRAPSGKPLNLLAVDEGDDGRN